MERKVFSSSRFSRAPRIMHWGTSKDKTLHGYLVHWGLTATKQFVSDRFWWTGVLNDVLYYVRNYHGCPFFEADHSLLHQEKNAID